jgi:2-polyprenyl-3-methyl-5-hydroxy-6-metoxy-1,4-benzoquinol methylase
MSFDKALYNIKKEEYYSQEREEMLKFVKPDVHNVLDVGCSSGGFGRLLKQRLKGIVWGVEPSDSAIEASKYLDRVFQDFFHSSLDFGDMKFDAVVFNDVLEHLVNPWEALTFSKKLLRGGGYIVASIPNVQCYQVMKNLLGKGEWNYASSGILDKTHLRFFTKKSIIQMFRDTGYEVIEIEGQNSVLQDSRLLRLCHFLFPKKTEPFLFINYCVCARKL